MVYTESGGFREAAFAKEDAELLTQIGSQVAIAVANALAMRELEVLKNKLAEPSCTCCRKVAGSLAARPAWPRLGMKRTTLQARMRRDLPPKLVRWTQAGDGSEQCCEPSHSTSGRNDGKH